MELFFMGWTKSCNHATGPLTQVDPLGAGYPGELVGGERD